MKILLIFFSFLYGCESYIYNDYKIINFKNNKKEIDFLTDKTYKVSKGDNLYSISRKFRVPIQSLISTNNIKLPYKIYPNQILMIPGNKIHKIRKGETLYSISRKYETNIYVLSKLNKLININSIDVGQRLIIPRRFLNNKKVYLNNNNVVKVRDTKKKEVLNKRTSKSNFLWPVKGKLLSKYGKSKDGFYNDGINIDSKMGTHVLSSDRGKVIYSGNEIPGYGNLILIKHPSNWITAYAHLEDIFIKKGIDVKRGEKIGSVGKTGNVNSPQLHFEIRKGKDAVNPLKFL